MASSRAATASTSAGGTNRNSGLASMNRAISHGQAMRSIFGRSRVTHFMGSLPGLTPERFPGLAAGVGPADSDVAQPAVVERRQSAALTAVVAQVEQTAKQPAREGPPGRPAARGRRTTDAAH